MEYAKRLISFQEMHPTKKIKVPVFRLLLQILLDNFESIISTGGQTFAYVPQSRDPNADTSKLIADSSCPSATGRPIPPAIMEFPGMNINRTTRV